MKQISLVLLITLVSACASKPPAAISKDPPENLTLTRVRMDIDRYIGSEVRWGGVISKVENKTDRTWVEIIRLNLRDNAGRLRAARVTAVLSPVSINSSIPWFTRPGAR